MYVGSSQSAEQLSWCRINLMINLLVSGERAQGQPTEKKIVTPAREYGFDFSLFAFRPYINAMFLFEQFFYGYVRKGIIK